MVVDFSKLNLKEPQVLILKNLDGTFIQPLTFAHNIQAKLSYIETSEIEFTLPAVVNGMDTSAYDAVVGMRLIDWLNVGQFIIIDPQEENDGINRVKNCKAYSLEHELTYKTIYMADGTYNFWDPVAPKDTVLGRILEVAPSWHIGSVDDELIGCYRTFEVGNENVYELIKGKLQDTYQCIFDFDTYDRIINVKSVSQIVDHKPVYLSLNNLIKDIKIEEDTENIYTVLDVNGADGVDILSVNPMGTNKIYNLDYFMNTTYFNQDLINKWNKWKQAYEDAQQSYYNLTIEKVLQEAQLTAEEAGLIELKNELSSLETLQSTYVSLAGQGYDRSEKLTEVKADIVDKRAEISKKEASIETLKTKIEEKFKEQQSYNIACNFETMLDDNGDKLFSSEELLLLNRYFKESSISEDSFVYQTATSYTADPISSTIQNCASLDLKNSAVTCLKLIDDSEISNELKQASAALAAYNAEMIKFGSHVDYLHRKTLFVTDENLKEYRAYFNDSELQVGDFLTLHSETYTADNFNYAPSTLAINVTPIMSDGSLFEDRGALLDYVAGLFDESGIYNASRDIKRIVMSVVDEGNQGASIKRAVELAVEAHNLHELYISLLNDQIARTSISSFKGGTLHLWIDGKKLVAPVINGVIECRKDASMIVTVHLSGGLFDDVAFKQGCLSICGNVGDISLDVYVDETGVLYDGRSIACTIEDGNLLFTQDVTEYAKRSVEWDLFEFGRQSLEELCWPTYTFSIDSANFLGMAEFEQFRNQFELGSRVYVDLGGKVLTPIAIGAEFDVEDLSSFKLTFGDNYSAKDSAFKMVDLLKESINMGKNTASNRFNYNQFVESGANTAVKQFMDAAIDAAKNAVLAGENQAVSIDGSGIRLRKWNKQAKDYDPQQIWMINNNIVFTENNWNTAKMALGHIVNVKENIDAWGLVADLVVGKLIAGENLVIESMQEDSTAVAFRVDSSGAQLHNARFDLIKGNGQLTLYPETGFVGGPKSSGDLLYRDDEGNWGVYANDNETILNSVSDIKFGEDELLPNANFWIDMEGNAYFKGSVYATDGYFSGEVHATGGTFKGELTAATGNFDGTVNALSFSLDGVCIDEIFSATPNDDGDLDYLKIGDITIDGKSGTITWDNMPDTGLSEDEVEGIVDGKIPDIEEILKRDYKIIKSTSIIGTSIESPVIKGNDIQVYGTFQTLDPDGDVSGYMGAATGKDADDDETYGVALATTNNLISYETVTTNYVIVTNAGVRMQAWGEDRNGDWSGHNITVTPNGAFYDGNEINVGGAGSITLVAKWG